jgi:hypothetical protein
VRREQAQVQKALHLEEFDEFCEAIGDQVDDWKKVVLDWEAGTSNQNPYAVVQTGSIRHG